MTSRRPSTASSSIWWKEAEEDLHSLDDCTNAAIEPSLEPSLHWLEEEPEKDDIPLMQRKRFRGTIAALVLASLAMFGVAFGVSRGGLYPCR